MIMYNISDMNFYELIFKRKSFHLFRDTQDLSDDDLDKVRDFISKVKPL